MESNQEIFIDRSIFRAYDIRGLVSPSLTADVVYRLGQALGTEALEKGEKAMALGFDGRHSSPLLAEILAEGILSTGCDCLDLGCLATPILYFATFVLETRSGVMITGSHNPSEYNGFKMVLKGETLAEERIQELYQAMVRGHFREGRGEYREVDLIEKYLERITSTVTLKRPLHIVVDAGHGVTGMIAPELYRRLGCEVDELYCQVDGSFPSHHPDPSQADNLKDLIQAVSEKKADLGLAFDGDGDRLGVVTRQGKIIWPDRQMILFSQAILAKQPHAKIIYDVKCTTHLADSIRKAKGEPIMWKTGHSLIKAKLLETGAVLAGEMSGHLFFKDRWFGFDDAMYAGARLLEILGERREDCETVFAAIPDSINTPELKVTVSDDEKFSLMEKLLHDVKASSAKLAQVREVLTIDGLRLNFEDGWGLVRPSNTTPCLVLRFEAVNENRMQTIQALFRDLLLSVKPSLALPF